MMEGGRVSAQLRWSGNFWSIDPGVEHQNKISPMGSYIEAVEKSRQSEIIVAIRAVPYSVCKCRPHDSTGSIARNGIRQAFCIQPEDYSRLIYQL
ncbi:hypothetical protein AVEN_255628-1 [Araneus ventricosus]|uniref:Uncharacterized protein n=1 Tax=Araneus ventricosus TaxID=182803 RepID=A0A4Y2W2G2_ARAVE|nr:hypothetical protein AVEN_255628-1 [Araneus ventricosus]